MISKIKSTTYAGFASQGLNILYGLLVIPFMLHYVSDVEVSFWLIILTFISFTMVIDFGFSPNIIRSVSFLYAGAQSLKKIGVEIKGSQSPPNWNGVLEMINLSKKIYLFLSLLAILFVGVGGSIYIFNFVDKNYFSYAYLIWLIFLFGFVVNIYFLYVFPILMGVHKIFEAHMVNIIIRLSWVLISLPGLVFFKSILVLPIAYVLGIIFGRIYSIIQINRIIKNMDKVETIKSTSGINFEIIFPNVWRTGLVTLSSFVINRASLLIVGVYFTTTEINSYGLTLQIIGVLFAFSQIYFNNHVPGFSLDRARGVSLALLRSNYYRALFKTLLIYITGALTLFFVSNLFFHYLIGISLVGNTILIIMLVITLLELHHSVAATLISTGNKIPFMISALISAGLIISISILIMEYIKSDLIYLVLVQGIVQVLYNNWKWPLEIYREIRPL